MSDNPVLRETQLAREGRVPTQHAPFAEHQLRVPVGHVSSWHQINGAGVWRPPIRVMFPGFDSKNHDEAQAAYQAFYTSEFADPYRVRNRKAQLGHL